MSIQKRRDARPLKLRDESAAAAIRELVGALRDARRAMVAFTSDTHPAAVRLDAILAKYSTETEGK